MFQMLLTIAEWMLMLKINTNAVYLRNEKYS